jgi:hypothetical protein
MARTGERLGSSSREGGEEEAALLLAVFLLLAEAEREAAVSTDSACSSDGECGSATEGNSAPAEDVDRERASQDTGRGCVGGKGSAAGGKVPGGARALPPLP